MQYSHRFSISCDIGYKSGYKYKHRLYILSKGDYYYLFYLYRGFFPTDLINFHFKFLHLIYKLNYNNVIVIIYTLSN